MTWWNCGLLLAFCCCCCCCCFVVVVVVVVVVLFHFALSLAGLVVLFLVVLLLGGGRGVGGAHYCSCFRFGFGLFVCCCGCFVVCLFVDSRAFPQDPAASRQETFSPSPSPRDPASPQLLAQLQLRSLLSAVCRWTTSGDKTCSKYLLVLCIFS